MLGLSVAFKYGDARSASWGQNKLVYVCNFIQMQYEHSGYLIYCI